MILGSSTAAAFRVDPEEGWVARYEEHLRTAHPGVSVKNLAVPGFSTFHVLPTGSPGRPGAPRVDESHNVSAALAEEPIAIIVNLPSNDAAMGVAAEDTLSNLRVVVETAKAAGVPTWVTTSQPRTLPPEGVARLERMRDAVLHDFGDHALNFWAPLAAPDGTPRPAFNQGDGVHPNAEGHRRLFEVVKTADVASHGRSTAAR